MTINPHAISQVASAALLLKPREVLDGEIEYGLVSPATSQLYEDQEVLCETLTDPSTEKRLEEVSCSLHGIRRVLSRDNRAHNGNVLLECHTAALRAAERLKLLALEEKPRTYIRNQCSRLWRKRIEELQQKPSNRSSSLYNPSHILRSGAIQRQSREEEPGEAEKLRLKAKIEMLSRRLAELEDDDL